MQMVVSGKIRQGGWDGEGSNGRKADTLLLKERGVEELKTGRGEGGRKHFLHFMFLMNVVIMRSSSYLNLKK